MPTIEPSMSRLDDLAAFCEHHETGFEILYQRYAEPAERYWVDVPLMRNGVGPTIEAAADDTLREPEASTHPTK